MFFNFLPEHARTEEDEDQEPFTPSLSRGAWWVTAALQTVRSVSVCCRSYFDENDEAIVVLSQLRSRWLTREEDLFEDRPTLSRDHVFNRQCLHLMFACCTPVGHVLSSFQHQLVSKSGAKKLGMLAETGVSSVKIIAGGQGGAAAQASCCTVSSVTRAALGCSWKGRRTADL